MRYTNNKKLFINIIYLLSFLFMGNAVAFAKITKTDLDNSIPVHYIGAGIMELDLENSYITVAEKEVAIVDLIIEDFAFKTEIYNTHGNSISAKDLKQGQYVDINAIILEDGQVIATEIKQVEKKKKKVDYIDTKQLKTFE